MSQFKNRVQFHPHRSSHSRSRQRFSPYHKPLMKEKHYKMAKQNKEKLTLHEPIIKVRQLIEGRERKKEGRLGGQRAYESNSGGSATNFSNCNFHSPFQTFDSQNYNQIISKIDQQSQIFKQHLSEVSRQLRLPKINAQQESNGLGRASIQKYEQNQGRILRCLQQLNRNNSENSFLKSMVGKYQQELLHLRELLERKQEECEKLQQQIMQLEKVIALDRPGVRRRESDQYPTQGTREESKKVMDSRGSHTEVVRVSKVLAKREGEGRLSLGQDILFSEKEGGGERGRSSVASIGENIEFIEELKREITELKLQNDLLNEEIKLLNEALNERDAKILVMKTSAQSEERPPSVRGEQVGQLTVYEQPELQVNRVRWSQSSRQVEDGFGEEDRLNEASRAESSYNGNGEIHRSEDVDQVHQAVEMYESLCGRKKSSSFIQQGCKQEESRRTKRALSLKCSAFLSQGLNAKQQQQRQVLRNPSKKPTASKFKKMNLQSDNKKMTYAKSFLKIRTRDSFLCEKNKQQLVRERKELRFYDQEMMGMLGLIRRTMTARCRILRKRYVDIQAELLGWGEAGISQREMREFLEENPFFLSGAFIEHLLRYILKEGFAEEEEREGQCVVEMDVFTNGLREFIEEFELWDEQMEVIMSEKVKSIVIERWHELMQALGEQEMEAGVVGEEGMRRVLEMFKFGEEEVSLVVNQCCLISADIQHLKYENYFALFRVDPEMHKQI